MASSIRIESIELRKRSLRIAIEKTFGDDGALVRLGTASSTRPPKLPESSFGNRCTRRVDRVR